MYTDGIMSIILNEVANYAEIISGVKATIKRSEEKKDRIPTDSIYYPMQVSKDSAEWVKRIAR